MTYGWCYRCMDETKKANYDNLFWVSPKGDGRSIPICGNHIKDEDNLMCTSTESEIIERFGNRFFVEKNLRDVETFHVLDWKESPEVMLKKVIETFGIEMKIINIGDADLYTFRKK